MMDDRLTSPPQAGQRVALRLTPQVATPAPGDPLWGRPAPRQPLLPIVALALITLLVSAPAALSGDGASSSNPLTVMKQIAAATYDMTQLTDESNKLLAKIDENARPLAKQRAAVEVLADSTDGMIAATAELESELQTVSATTSSVAAEHAKVDATLTELGAGIGGMSADLNASLTTTRDINRDFTQMNASVARMRRSLRRAIRGIGTTAPLTKEFAENRTVVDIAGGSDEKFGVPNLVAGNRVMSVVLPLINTMQQGGPIAARKDSAEASNILVRTVLKRQIPDGTNIGARVHPYDGRYGLPSRDWFVNHRVGGI